VKRLIFRAFINVRNFYLMSAMTDNEVLPRFREYKRLLINFVGRAPMEETKIDEIGKAEFGKRWAGVFASDEAARLLRMKDRFAIVNTATSHGRGSHWLGVYMSRGGACWLYDSFGREASHVCWRLNRAALEHHIAIRNTNPNHEQRGTSAVCGHLSLAFLLTVRDLGIRATAEVI
jgi:hypothetical protein